MLGVKINSAEPSAQSRRKFVLCHLGTVVWILCVRSIDAFIGRGNNQPAFGCQNANTFVKKTMRVGNVLDGLEGNDYVNRTVGDRNVLSATLPRIEPVSVACMKTNVLCNVYSGHIDGTRFLKSCRSVTLAARNIQNALPSYKTRRKRIPINVLPEREPVRRLRNHAFARGFKDQRVRIIHVIAMPR